MRSRQSDFMQEDLEPGCRDTHSKWGDPSSRKHSLRLLDLSTELLEYISTFLRPSSIRTLMVNKSFQALYEPILYQEIILLTQPYASLRLLKTFTVRPDLALRVRSLYLDLRLCVEKEDGTYGFPPSLAFNELGALRLTRNVRSFGVVGLQWLSDPTLHTVREAISGMKLKRLWIRDFYCCFAVRSQRGTVVSNLREILRAQPLLEELAVNSSAINTTANQKPFPLLESSEVPKLRRLRTVAGIAGAFLTAAPCLDDLSVCSGSDVLSGLLSVKIGGAKIRKLGISLEWDGPGVWENLGEVLTAFPNTEVLRVRTTWPKCDIASPRVGFYLEKIASEIGHLRFLRQLELSYFFKKTSVPESLNEKVLVKFKSACPVLESVIDSARREWRFDSTEESQNRDAPRLMIVNQDGQGYSLLEEDLRLMGWEI